MPCIPISLVLGVATDTGAEMSSGRSNFPASFPYLCSFLIQRISTNFCRRINAISFWISEKKQSLLEFKSQVVVQNHVLRQL